MNYTDFIVGVVVGAGIVSIVNYLRGREKPFGSAQGKKIGLIERQRIEKEQDKERIYGLLETNTPLTNEHVRMMLDIPESTATRYFEELEKEGKVRQVGKSGPGVYYERTN